MTISPSCMRQNDPRRPAKNRDHYRLVFYVFWHSRKYYFCVLPLSMPSSAMPASSMRVRSTSPSSGSLRVCRCRISTASATWFVLHALSRRTLICAPRSVSVSCACRTDSGRSATTQSGYETWSCTSTSEGTFANSSCCCSISTLFEDRDVSGHPILSTV